MLHLQFQRASITCMIMLVARFTGSLSLMHSNLSTCNAQVHDCMTCMNHQATKQMHACKGLAIREHVHDVSLKRLERDILHAIASLSASHTESPRSLSVTLTESSRNLSSVSGFLFLLLMSYILLSCCASPCCTIYTSCSATSSSASSSPSQKINHSQSSLGRLGGAFSFTRLRCLDMSRVAS